MNILIPICVVPCVPLVTFVVTVWLCKKLKGKGTTIVTLGIAAITLLLQFRLISVTADTGATVAAILVALMTTFFASALSWITSKGLRYN